MNRKYTLLSLLLVIGFSLHSKGQSACPPNIDFEYGTTANWLFYTSSYTGGTIPTGTLTPPINGRHNLMTSGGGTDYYGGFPIVSPSGGTTAMRLGYDTTGQRAEKARYYVRVPSGSANYALVYRYAVVFQNPPSHDSTEQPRFEVSAKDSATGADVPCAAYSYVATSGLPGFLTSSMASRTNPGDASPIFYKDWTTATMNLSGLGGTTIMIDFAAADCSLGGHFGYGYFDMTCGLFQVAGLTCDDTATTATLSGPDGYEFYHWWDSATFTVPYGSTRTVTIPIPSGPTTYAVILTPYSGYGCPDTLYCTLSPNHLALHPTPDTLICNGTGAMITSGATDVALPLSYSWGPATGLSCTTCANPIASPGTTTTYTVTVTNNNGCTKDTTITVTIGNLSSTITGFTRHVQCAGFTTSATATVMTGQPPFTYVWSTMPVQTTATATGLSGAPTSVVYSVTITDDIGCINVDTVTIFNGPPTVISIVSSTNITRCLDSNGTITLNGLVAGSTFTITYLFNGVFQSQTLLASGAGTVTLVGLKQGLYSNITVIPVAVTNFCTYNVVGPLTLSDPPPTSIPALNSNSPVCLGSPLNLTALSATAGVTYSWTGPGGFSSGVQNPTVNPANYSDSGVYVATVVVNNCFAKDSIRVKVIPLPFPAAINSSPVCSGDTLFLSGSSSNGASSYTWYGPDGFYSYSKDPFIDNVQVPAAGTYTVTVSLNGCFASATTDVIVNQTPGAPETADTEYCQLDVVPPLTAVGTGLMWYTQAVGGIGTPIAPTPSTLNTGKTTWYVSQISSAGCEGPRAPITVQIDYLATPKLEISDSVICKGTDIMFTAMGTGDDMTRINWYFSDGDSIMNHNPIPHSFTHTGQFLVTATAYYKVCPVKTASRIVTILPSPNVYLGGDTSICPGGVAIVLNDNANSSNTAAKWSWSTGSTQSFIRVTSPGTYFVRVAIDGCYSTDTIVVYNDCYMNLPNVFTPNGDGMNDYFFPRELLTKGLTAFKMDIYNRWGQLVFSSNTLDGRGWDGKFNNQQQPQGVFVYIIDATFKDGQKEHHQGNVTLLR